MVTVSSLIGDMQWMCLCAGCHRRWARAHGLPAMAADDAVTAPADGPPAMRKEMVLTTQLLTQKYYTPKSKTREL